MGVAYCRSELVLLTDRDNADRFLRDYEAAAGAVDNLPFFDVVCGLNAYAWCEQWSGAFALMGRTVSVFRMRDALERLLESAVAEC